MRLFFLFVWVLSLGSRGYADGISIRQPGRLADVSGDEPQFELKGRFIQITDIHPDKHYLEGSLARTACHRMPLNDTGIRRKSRKNRINSDEDHYRGYGSDFRDDDNRIAGFYAVPDGPCDSPYSLINATFEYIEKVWADKIDFIVWTGDNARHDNDNHFPRSPLHIFDANREIRDYFYAIFKHENPLYPLKIPLIPSFGNNDVWPHNIFAPGPNYQTRSYATLWGDMIPEYEVHTFERGGYFAVEIVPNKLAVISLNTLYWFGSNAAVDGCDHKSEPGSLQFEWLRVQLTEYRKRGVKAWLTGHVPPGRKFYYPSCFRRYALYTHAFRDVVLGHLYGHNNMDHFYFLDAEQALQEEEEAQILKRLIWEEAFDITSLSEEESPSFQRLISRTPASRADLLDFMYHIDDGDDGELFIQGIEEYITTLKESFDQIPHRPKPPKKWKDGKKGEKQRNKFEKKWREYEENYQVVQVAPSIIPAYWTGIRVIEYNISALNGVQFSRNAEPMQQINWTEWWLQMDKELEAEEFLTDKETAYQGAWTIQQPNTIPEEDPNLTKAKKKKKKSKNPVYVPPGPHKNAPRGPIYESQLFTPTRWEVHFVNLTAANAEHDADPSQEWDYGHGFFQLEYASDDAPYAMGDLTMKTWLELAIDIAKEKVVKNATGLSAPDRGKGKKEEDKETYWDVFLRRAFINSGHVLDFEDDD